MKFQKRKRKAKKYVKNRRKQKKLNISQEQIQQTLLKAYPSLSCLFPETIRLQEASDVCSFLDRHHHVILKPISQTLGTEIVTILLDSKNQYEIQHGKEMIRFTEKEHMVSYITNHIQLACYLAQQYIEFARIKNNLFDLRVILHQRKGSGIWEVTERYVEATNEICTIQQAIHDSNLQAINRDKLLKDIDTVALQGAQKLGEAIPHHRIWGLNLKLDSDGTLWISKTYAKPPKVKGNKQKMYSFLKTDEYVSSLFPETIPLNEKHDLWFLLDKYRHVVLKPISGSLGTGIIKIVKDSDEQYEMQYRNKIRKGLDKRQLFTHVKQKMKPKPYLVQAYIQLAQVEYCPFDVRVIVQRKKNECAYTVTGIYAKVAQEGYFTTNLAKKGKVFTLQQAIDCSDIKKVTTIDDVWQNIDCAAVTVAQKLGEVAPLHCIWGLDVGIDFHGKLWIIEVNSNPGMKGFKRLKNKSMYKTIQAYKRKH
ncbi:YheC/YheD family protein [Bacillus cereus]|uniref:ATP-grasp domain-containing protein n=1 Tax=Bacillus cereus TaxID=1396 RepID=A0A2B9E1I9_BACCE|nr:YheC/YheD family protein [Bacillus cereus]PGM93713.1 hypothetical protein CN958_12415 [Bacillus cereus]